MVFDNIVISPNLISNKHKWGVFAERIRAPNSSSGVSVQQSVGSNPGRDTWVSEQNCFSPPSGKWVPVRAEMVLVVVYLVRYIFGGTGCILPKCITAIPYLSGSLYIYSAP